MAEQTKAGKRKSFWQGFWQKLSDIDDRTGPARLGRGAAPASVLSSSALKARKPKEKYYDAGFDENVKAISDKIVNFMDTSTGRDGGDEKNKPAGTTGPQVSNGTRQAQPTQGTPVQAPRPAAPSPQVSTTYRGSGHQTQVNGKDVGGDSTSQANLKTVVRNETARVASETNTARKDAAYQERKADAERGTQEVRDRLERADKNKEYWDKRLAARNEELYDKKRANTREEWENLGRLRGDEARDGKALSDDEYNAKVKGLFDRAAALRKNQKENAYLKQSDASAMQSFFKNVGKVTFDEKGNAVHANGKRFTNAQLAALEGNIAKYEGAADERKATLAARTKAAEAQGLAEYRAQNGLQGFSDDEVRKFRRGKTARDVKGVLEAMASDGTPKDAAGYDNFATRWEALAKSGADFEGAHAKALKTMSPEAKAKYMSMLVDAPDAESRQTLRQNIILNQLYTDNGIKNPGAVQDRRTMKGEVPDYEQTLADNLRTNATEKLTDAPAVEPKAGQTGQDSTPTLTPRADPMASLQKKDPLAEAGLSVPEERNPNALITDEQAIASMNSAADKADVDNAIEIDEDALQPKQPAPETPEQIENKKARRIQKAQGF